MSGAQEKDLEKKNQILTALIGFLFLEETVTLLFFLFFLIPYFIVLVLVFLFYPLSISELYKCALKFAYKGVVNLTGGQRISFLESLLGFFF